MGVRFTCLRKGSDKRVTVRIISKGGKKEIRKEKKSKEPVNDV